MHLDCSYGELSLLPAASWMPKANRQEMTLGLYIHIPFCKARCNYCHFVTRPWHAPTVERYYRAVVRELREFAEQHPCREEVDTIYFGGGTPSIVPAEHVAGILDTCRGQFRVLPDCEITLEANPGSLTPEKAESYCRAGVNRISLGAQSFDDKELAAIRRDHTGDQIDETLELLRAKGILNLNLDVLLGLPRQTRSTWENNLQRIVRVAPPHISVYMLDLDERSPLYHSIAKGRDPTPDDDLTSDLYLGTIGFLGRHGYQQYEISNFALPGSESRHNLKYWCRAPVIGFGVASHSFDGRARFANFARLSAYLGAVEAGRQPIEWHQAVPAGQRLEETLFLGLRLNRGVDWAAVQREHNNPRQLADYESALRGLSDKGLLEWQDSVVRLTPRGMLLSNEVFVEFV